MSGLDLGDPASWRPVEEFPGQLFTERTWLVGAIILGVAYGVELTLFSQCMTLLIKQTKRANLKSTMPLIVYISCLFICGSIFMGAAANMARLSFIDNRNIPGGPSIYETVMFSIPVDNQGNAAFVIANWLADGLMAWRWFVIYRTCKLHIAIVMFIPVATLTTSFIMGTLFLVQVSAPASSIWATNSINFTLPYFCISLALNIVSTIAIVSRLLYYRHRTASTLGTAHGTQYTTIASMLVESAAVYSISSLLFLVPFIVEHPIQNVFLGLLSPAQVIAPLMIIYRVAQGRAWASNTATKIMTRNARSNGQDFYLEEGRGESTPEFKPTGSI
ncbi:hypothetical protein BDZ94DRAFT_1287535 [Collybia nuda]|uniref:Uncharacterized protein n=1 Tax=Collybia nuda TaxID=64659 RepID=A0A9P5YHG6_9AGAR|nr:hypothetical protein BDZ94DRAFT_1287535 [Collybia nuda]